MHNVFKWLVLNTKELRRFHAMFASSDSFFHLWVAKYIGSTRYESYVIGDLTKDEAKLYWEEKGKQMEVELATCLTLLVERHMAIPVLPILF